MVIETVAMLSGYATWTHPEGIRDGSYAREVGIMIAAYLVRSSADG